MPDVYWKRIEMMSERELRQELNQARLEVQRYKLALVRIAEGKEGHLLQDYQQIARDALPG